VAYEQSREAKNGVVLTQLRHQITGSSIGGGATWRVRLDRIANPQSQKFLLHQPPEMAN
jgi:hypothetical protein